MTPTTLKTPRPSSDSATEEDVYYCYRLLLGREPDEQGLRNWRVRLDGPPTPLEDLTRGFVQSKEFRARHHLKPAPEEADGRIEPRPPTLAWKLMRALIARSKEHAFLDRPWISPLLRAAPRRFRTPLALRLLSLSPHYWVYQWTSRYPAEYRRGAVLAHEFARNATSRREIYEKLLRRFLRPEMTVLDFGCGPGFLAKEAASHAAKVIGADVSRGTIACARVLNPAPNLSYIANRSTSLAGVADASVDLVYSFAVFQHLRREQTIAFLREFARILKPGGQGVFHTILKRVGEEQYTGDPGTGGWLEKDVHLRMVYLTNAEIADLLGAAGFSDVKINPIASLADIEDDIGHEHLVTFRR